MATDGSGLRAIDLFSGAGGLSLGLSRAGIDIHAAVDCNRDAMATYASHTPNAAHFAQDVRSIDFRAFRGKVDLVTGGPPCQPFSLGGKRHAHRDERDMIPEFLRCLSECMAEFFLMENVPGFTMRSVKEYFDSILLRLSDLGYKLNWAVLNAADYGAPQKRRRLFILGSRKLTLRFPAPSHGPGLAYAHQQSKDYVSAEPIGEPPKCPVKFARYPDLRPSPYAGHIYNGGGRPLDPNGPAHTILASSGGYKTHWVDTAGIAPEYHAHLMAGGKPREGVVPGARRLTVEECAVLQTFPANVQFVGSRSSKYTQVGDSVPPAVAEALARSLVAQITGKASECSLLHIDPAHTVMQGVLLECR